MEPPFPTTSLEAGRDVLVVAHGNSLRGLVKAIDQIDATDIERVRFPHGVPLVYKFAFVAPDDDAASGGASPSASDSDDPNPEDPRVVGDMERLVE